MMHIFGLLLFGTFAGILSNFLILYWFGKEIPMFFQIQIINKNSAKIALYTSLIGSALTYTIIILLANMYIGYIKGISETVLANLLIIELSIEVFLTSILFLGGRSLLYGKIVKNLTNKNLKVFGCE